MIYTGDFSGKLRGIFLTGCWPLSLFPVNRLKERTSAECKNERTPGNEMPVSIHHQYYLGEGPATRYYRGLERRADFIMVPRERENRRMECGMVGWLALGSCVEVRSVESIAGAWRPSRVYKARDRMLGRRNACERAAHTHTHTHSKNLRVPERFLRA